MRKWVSAVMLAAFVMAVPAVASGGTHASGHAKATSGAAAAPEPKHLEAKLTIVLGDAPGHMFFATAKGERGGPFVLPAGKTVGIKLVNRGTVGHEIRFGRNFDASAREYRVNPFASVPADIFVFKPAKMEVGGARFVDIEMEPGAEMWIRTVFPATMKGKWEIGCLLEGHRELGMVATLVIR